MRRRRPTSTCSSGVFSNPAIVDTTRRVAFDGSSRHPGFVLPILRDGLRTGAPVEGLALVEALWARMCEGTREDGSVIEPNDPFWDDLRTTAKAARDRPRTWLDQRRVYGDLVEAPRFVEAFRTLARHDLVRGLRSGHAGVRDGVAATLAHPANAAIAGWVHTPATGSPASCFPFAGRMRSTLRLENQRRERRQPDLDGIRPSVAPDGVARDTAEVAVAPAAVIGSIGVDALEPSPRRRHADAPRGALRQREVSHDDDGSGVPRRYYYYGASPGSPEAGDRLV